jgi:hypothetical protein
MDTNKLINSKGLKWLIIVVAEIALLTCVFRAGMAVGFSKANFNYRWGENYHRLFGGPESGWMMQGFGYGGRGGGGMMGGPGGYFSPSHNVVGTVIKVTTSTIIVKGADNVEQSLLVTPQTTIRSGREMIRLEDIKENDQIVGLGSPSTTGQVEIKFLRVFNQ